MWNDCHCEFKEADIRLRLLQQQDQVQPGAHPLRGEAALPGAHVHVHRPENIRRSSS